MKTNVERISTVEFLESAEFYNYVCKRVAAFENDWDIPNAAIYFQRGNNFIAYTDKKAYYVNIIHEIIDREDREKAALTILGLLCHEVGHRIFTNFTAASTYFKNMLNGVLWHNTGKYILSQKDKENYNELLQALKEPNKAKLIASMVKHIINSIEDGRIETLINMYEKHARILIEGLSYTREVHHMYFIKRFSAGEGKDTSILPFVNICNLILYQATCGDIENIANDFPESAIEKVRSIKGYIISAMQSLTATEYYKNINMILIKIWDEIKTAMNNQKSQTNQEAMKSGNLKNDLTDEEMESLSRQLNSILIDETNNKQLLKSSGSDAIKIKDILKRKTANKPRSRKTDVLTAIAGNEKEKTIKLRESDPEALNDFTADVNKLARLFRLRKIDAEKEKEFLENLKSSANTINYGKAHEGMVAHIYQQPITDMAKKVYWDAAKEPEKIGIRISKAVSKYFDTEPENVIVKNRYVGTKFNADSVARADFRYFSEERKAEERPSVAFSLLIDESGSMGNKVGVTKATAIMFKKFCELLDLPHSIYGHTSGGYNGVPIFLYCDNARTSKEDKYRLMNITSRAGNRDGFAIRFVGDRLLKCAEQDRILMIISDGAPADRGYYGSAAEADIGQAVKTLEKKGVRVIAAGLGEDASSLERIYGKERFLDVSNIEELPKTFAKILKNSIRRK